MKKSLYFFILLMLFACGSETGDVSNSPEPRDGRLALKVAHAWIPENMMQFSSAHRSGLFENKVFFIQNRAEEMVVKFMNLDGTAANDIVLPKGKGPGEVIYTVGMRFHGGKIFFMDTVLGRVSVFDYEGEYLDDYPMDADTGRIWKFDIIGKHMYFNSFAKNRNICKYDLESGEIIKRIGDDLSVLPVNGDQFSGGCIEVYSPEERIYYAYESYPVRIEEYDTGLNLLRTIRRSDKGRKPAEWIVTPRMVDRHGDIAITSMKIDKKYIYMLNNGANYNNSAGNIENVDLSLSVFDRRTGKYIKELYVGQLENIPQYASIVGVDKEHIVLTSLNFAEDNVLEKLGLEMQGGPTLVFVIAENPMYVD